MRKHGELRAAPLRALRALALLIVVLSVGTVHAGSVDVDFNPKAEFQRYRTWAWLPDHDKGLRGVLADATMRQRVEKALGIRLREAGLTPAEPNAKPDLYVSYRGDTGQGKDVSSNLGGLSSFDNPLYTSVQFTEQTATLMIDLVDAGTNALAWRLYIDQTVRGPNDPPDKLSKALDKGFAKYPPSAAAIAKKAKALEKSSGAK
jgi:hypothetical protein